MSSRYTISASAESITKRFGVDATPAYKRRFNIAPTQLTPVITNESPRGFSFFYWGLISNLANNKSLSERLYITRAENIPEKLSFQNALRERRCIIPADGFYEWKKVSKKGMVPYYYYLKSREPFGMAGLWEEFENEEGESVHAFTLISCLANDLVKESNERMPVILENELFEKWLDKQTPLEELIAMLTTFPALKMERHSVSHKINSLNFDDPSLIAPAPASDQFGNYTLFG